MNEQQTAALLKFLAGYYPNFPVDENRLRVWGSEFANVEVTKVKAAVQAYVLSHRQFGPTPGQLKELLGEGPPGSRAIDAWDSVVGFLEDMTEERYPSEEIWAEEHPDAARALASCGGMQAAYSAYRADSQRLSFIRRDFMQAFTARADGDVRAQVQLEASGESASLVQQVSETIQLRQGEAK